eukprot:5177664-Prymnesium_polylepis.1
MHRGAEAIESHCAASTGNPTSQEWTRSVVCKVSSAPPLGRSETRVATEFLRMCTTSQSA